MKKNIVKVVIASVALLAVLLGLTFNQIFSPALMTNAELSANGLYVYDEPRPINEFTLIDHNGNTVDSTLLQDKWTVVTKDKSLSAQWEHTLLVTADGVEVLTKRPDETI